MPKSALLIFPALLLGACASLLPPSSEELAELPVVRYGNPAPADGNFVLLYPSGVELPLDTAVEGDVFEKNEQATLKPRLKRDIYIYKTWASLDGKHWQRGTALVAGRIEFRLPGETDGRTAGQLRVEFNRK
ncbi:MAG: hypothetical protein PHD19_10150 [Dechloromonas sp.]|nr:hypothetical protein [Dechloromonas sp.]